MIVYCAILWYDSNFNTIINLDSNLYTRITSISFYSEELQERLIIIDDSWKSLITKPLGLGPTSFQYLQYYFQSAFYDVKYIHSSPLQVGFDLGILGMIIYSIMFCWESE